MLLLLFALLAKLLTQGLMHLLRLLLAGVALLGFYHLMIVEIYSIRGGIIKQLLFDWKIL